MLATVVDTGDLLSVLWTSLAAGLGICVAFSLTILGATRAVDLRRDGRAAAAGIYLGLAGLAVVVVVGGVIFGIVVMTQK